MMLQTLSGYRAVPKIWGLLKNFGCAGRYSIARTYSMARHFDQPNGQKRGYWYLLNPSMWQWASWFDPGYHLQWSKNPPFMIGLGWSWELVWACFMRMTASLDPRTYSGSKGPSMYLSDSSIGLTWCQTSQNPTP